MDKLFSILQPFADSLFAVGSTIRHQLSNKASPGQRWQFITSQDIRAIREELLKYPEFSSKMEIKRGGEIQFEYTNKNGSPLTIHISPFKQSKNVSKTIGLERALSPLEMDLASREITIQAIARDAFGRWIDPFGGIEDFRNGIIRPVISGDIIFKVNPLFLLKIARYTGQYGFRVAEDVEKFARRDSGNILDTSHDLWRLEMDKILLSPSVKTALQTIEDLTVLRFILPEVATLVGFDETCDLHHKDVWEHTKQVVAQSPQNLFIRWASLLHDIGKVWTRTVSTDGRIHFFRHEDLGYMLFEGIANRFRFDAQRTEQIGFIVKNHSRINLYEESWTESAIRRLIRESSDHLPNLLEFSKADITTSNPKRREQLLVLIQELEKRIEEVRIKDSYRSPLPKGIGNDIMKYFNLTEGPVIGQLRKIIEEAILNGQLEENSPVKGYLDFLEKNHKEIIGGL